MNLLPGAALWFVAHLSDGLQENSRGVISCQQPFMSSDSTLVTPLWDKQNEEMDLTWTNLGLGAVVLLDDGPLLPVQAVAHPELLHEDVFVPVLPSLNHHPAQHLLQAQIHLPAGPERFV